jgi:hypothetical protein
VVFYASFEALTVVMFQVEVFWVVTSCNVLVEFQCFRGLRCLHLLHPAGSFTIQKTST